MAYKKMPPDAVTRIVVHASATPSKMDIGVAEIDRWHRERGFLKVGYHYVIRRDGVVEEGRKLDHPGAHAKGYNDSSIGVCLVGGFWDGTETGNNFDPDQFDALEELLLRLADQFPMADIVGHRDLPGVSKACPCFDVTQFCNDRHIH